MKLTRFIPCCFLILLFVGCHEEVNNINKDFSIEKLKEWNVKSYTLYSYKIRNRIDELRFKEGVNMYADIYTNKYYSERKDFLWITRSGVNQRADSLLKWLDRVPELGLNSSGFYTQEIRKKLKKLRSLDFEQDDEINILLADLEFHLTKAYLRYSCGQRFGFLKPQVILNQLERTDTVQNSPYRQLFDIKIEQAEENFVNQAIAHIEKGTFHDFFHEIHPQNDLYKQLVEELKKTPANSKNAETIKINIERSRWRQPLPKGKYVWINTAGFELRAVDEEKDSFITMRVCGGDLKHKTPLLTSRITRVELNPYWTIPFSIIRKEIAPRHAGEIDYFERNRIRIINRTTGEEFNPADITANMLTSGNYTLRQDNGEGNSLGRMIFRFPNHFAVYLHDTNNRDAFRRTHRAVSHGCIRLERPLDLAIFLMNPKDETLVDRIRIAIDLPPLTEKGKRILEDPDHTKMGVHSFTPQIPVFIVYYTIYPNESGKLIYYPDSYGYDKILLKKLEQL